MIPFELKKLWRSKRPLIALGILIFFLLLMLMGFYTYAKSETGGKAEFRYTFENKSYFNGLTFTLYTFYFSFLLIIPILVASEGGVQIAGEAEQRTLWLMLARPVSPVKIFFTKMGISLFYLFFVVGLFLASTLFIGLLAVGWGDLHIYPGVLKMADQHQFIPQNQALLRFLVAWPAASLALFVHLSMSYLFSTWSKSSVNAVGVSISTYLVLYVVCEIHFFENIRPYLFTTYQDYWRKLFQEDIPWYEMFQDACKLMGYAFLFLSVALYRFRKREEK